ncbi:Zinc finger RING-type [Trinorchestia longiramus]|nr:Zinc finger RING-type [Trinorchestia longiramus]
MGELGGTLWESYLSLVGEVQQVTEVIGAGLAVAVRLNHDVIASLLNISSRIIHLLLLLLMKTREMVSLLKSDLLEFLSDVGSGVHLFASALANLGRVVTSADFQHVLRNSAILVSVILGLIFVFVLCNYCGVLQLLAATVKCFLVVTSWILRTFQSLGRTLARCTIIAIGDVVPPQEVNYIYLERQINSDAVNMDVNRLDAYLVARLNMDRHNDMVYHYIVQNSASGSLYVTVKPLVKKVNFFESRFNRAREILGIPIEVTAFVSKVTWNIDHNFRTGRNYRVKTARSRDTERRMTDGGDDAVQLPECIVCQDRGRSVLLMPCRHLCLCQVCCSAILRSNNKLCPVCRHPIGTVCEVYI